MLTLTLGELTALEPCEERLDALAPAFKGKALNAAGAVAAGATLDDLLWVAGAVARNNPGVEKRLRLFAADAAERVLPLYEAVGNIAAPRKAIEVARAYARGKATDEELSSADAVAAATAHAADAYDATYAAAAADAMAAATVRAADAPVAAADAAAYAYAAEREWQLGRLVYWLTEEEI